MKVIWNGREVEISPKIVELLKKRGWTWPFSEEVKRERIEASKRFVPMSTPPEILEEMAGCQLALLAPACAVWQRHTGMFFAQSKGGSANG